MSDAHRSRLAMAFSIGTDAWWWPRNAAFASIARAVGRCRFRTTWRSTCGCWGELSDENRWMRLKDATFGARIAENRGILLFGMKNRLPDSPRYGVVRTVQVLNSEDSMPAAKKAAPAKKAAAPAKKAAAKSAAQATWSLPETNLRRPLPHLTKSRRRRSLGGRARRSGRGDLGAS